MTVKSRRAGDRDVRGFVAMKLDVADIQRPGGIQDAAAGEGINEEADGGNERRESGENLGSALRGDVARGRGVEDHADRIGTGAGGGRASSTWPMPQI